VSAAGGALCALAPAKVNLGLFVGPRRADGRHELVTVMQSISLADELELSAAPPGTPGDEVICPGVDGLNLAAQALSAFRAATGWDAPPQRLRIDKRVPVAAGLGGGSGDAAAALRLAGAASGLGDDALLSSLAAQLGADVPAQVRPGRWLATGAGERLTALSDPPPFGLVVLPVAAALSTAQVYAQADRLGGLRALTELEHRRHELSAALALGTPVPPAHLLANDLQGAAVHLCPEVEQALRAVRDAGADAALLCGSGPTVVGLFARANASGRVQRALAALADRRPEVITAEPVASAFAAVHDCPLRHNGPLAER